MSRTIRDEIYGSELAFLNTLEEKYQIIDRTPVGEGKLAKIYKARDKGTDRIVSIKILRAQNENLKNSFDKSAKRAVQISDETPFLTIYDVHLNGKYHYYVRQFIEGQDLRTYIDNWIKNYQYNDNLGLPVEDVRKIILEIGEGLERAHKKIQQLGLECAYIDIKPSNVLLSHGSPFISSFNIFDGFQTGKILNELRTNLKVLDKRLVQEELAYLLPDYFYYRTSASVNYEKADQYMLGLLAYELLTGKMPPTLKNLQELKSKHFDAFNQIGSIPRTDCPGIVKTVILRMIRKNPEERFERFCDAVNVLRNLDIHLTMVEDSYLRCINSPEFSDEKFFEFFLKNLKELEADDVYQKLTFLGDKSKKIRHASSLKQSILFLFAYFEQNKRFYKNTGKTEEPNILSGIAKTHHKDHKIPKELYKPFGEALINTIAEFDKEFNNHHMLKDMWQHIYNSAVEYMTSRYSS